MRGGGGRVRGPGLSARFPLSRWGRRLFRAITTPPGTHGGFSSPLQLGSPPPGPGAALLRCSQRKSHTAVVRESPPTRAWPPRVFNKQKATSPKLSSRAPYTRGLAASCPVGRRGAWRPYRIAGRLTLSEDAELDVEERVADALCVREAAAGDDVPSARNCSPLSTPAGMLTTASLVGCTRPSWSPTVPMTISLDDDIPWVVSYGVCAVSAP